MTAVTLVAVSSAFAGTVETLLMPGKVTRLHEKQEQDCANCHDRSNVRTQTSLCLDCHKDIAADVRDHKDYHGRMQNAGTGECRACHTEHKGRAADIVQLRQPALSGLEIGVEGPPGPVDQLHPRRRRQRAPEIKAQHPRVGDQRSAAAALSRRHHLLDRVAVALRTVDQ